MSLDFIVGGYDREDKKQKNKVVAGLKIYFLSLKLAFRFKPQMRVSKGHDTIIKTAKTKIKISTQRPEKWVAFLCHFSSFIFLL